MRTLVSLLLIALALYTVEALAQESKEAPKTTWYQEAGVMPIPDQGNGLESNVIAYGQNCDYCVKNAPNRSGYYSVPLITPTGSNSQGESATDAKSATGTGRE